MRDATARYFNEHCHDYSVARLDYATRWLVERGAAVGSLLDLGCGTGNVLRAVVERTRIADVAGVDASERPLATTAARLGCPTYRASVLDPDLPRRVGRRFDIVLLVAVLHHLVAGTRRSSRRLAERALANACLLAAPGGHVIVHEPVFAPRAAMFAVFHVKRAVTTVTPGRVPVLGYWNNIGAPVVSYLTAGQLERLAAAQGEVVATDIADRRLHPLLRACGIRRRGDATVILRPHAA